MIKRTNLFIVGAMKSGTTTLFNLLGSHPEINMSSVKETEFFLQDDDYIIKNLENYHRHFNTGTRYRLESTVLYTSYPLNTGVEKKIHQYNPQASILYIIRNPLDRIESHHYQAFNRGYTREPDINKAIKQKKYVEFSKYHTQIKGYLDLFGRENVKILFFEDLLYNPEKVISEVCIFLDLKPIDPAIDFKLHKNRSTPDRWLNINIEKKLFNGPYRYFRPFIPSSIRTFIRKRVIMSTSLKEKPKLSLENRKKIIGMLNSEIEEIEKLTGKNLESWRHI